MSNRGIYETVHVNTHFSDIDGTLFKYRSSLKEMIEDENPEILPGVLESIKRWYLNGDVIILVTARPEKYRADTLWQLEKVGIKRHMYDYLIMGVGTGDRIVYNDISPTKGKRAIACNLPRDEGFENLEQHKSTQ